LLKISKIILYNEPTVSEIQIERLQKFLKESFPINVETRGNIFNDLDDNGYEKIASTRIFDIKKPFQKHLPTIDEVLIEKENRDMSKKEDLVLYEGIEFQMVISDLIVKNKSNADTLHIIFTNKLPCTFDEDDSRYHARAIICSNPSIISTTGIVEAPAKPRQYYLDMMTNFSNEDINNIKKKYKGRFIEYHDSRTSKIIEGYLLQAIIYYETGEAFCTDKKCRIYNSHWQEDLIYSQLENKKLCKKHEAILKGLR